MSSLRRLSSWIFLSVVACSRDERSAPREPVAPEEGPSSVTAAQLLAKVRGFSAKGVLVNAWATWCDSCEHELPMLQRLNETFAERGVRVLLVSVDEPSARANVRAFLAQNQITLTSYLAARPLDTFKAGMNPRWPGMLPASFLFDGTGKLRYFWGGEAFENEVVPVLDGLLAGKNIDGEAQLGVAPDQPTDHPTGRF